jgi:hypothetical protein
VPDCKILGQSRHKSAIPSRTHRPGFDRFSDLVHRFSQLFFVKSSAPSQRAFQHVLANLEELKSLQKMFEHIVPTLDSHIELSYSVVPSARQDEEGFCHQSGRAQEAGPPFVQDIL